MDANGRLKIEAHVIEGLGDVSDTAQLSWLFEGENSVWDEQGNLVAVFHYVKGILDGTALYYHPNGQVARSIPYVQDKIEGEMLVFDDKGRQREKIRFVEGNKHGVSEGKGADASWSYREVYDKGLLKHGLYSCSVFSVLPSVSNSEGHQAIYKDGHLVSLVEIHDGKPEGSVRTYELDGSLKNLYHLHNEKKHGEESEYYPSAPLNDPLALPARPKMLVFCSMKTFSKGILKLGMRMEFSKATARSNQNTLHGLASAYY